MRQGIYKQEISVFLLFYEEIVQKKGRFTMK